MHTRLQFTLPEEYKPDIFKDLKVIAPHDKAIIATTTSPSRVSSFLLVVITDDYEIECMLRLKYAGYETYTTRF